MDGFSSSDRRVLVPTPPPKPRITIGVTNVDESRTRRRPPPPGSSKGRRRTDEKEQQLVNNHASYTRERKASERNIDSGEVLRSSRRVRNTNSGNKIYTGRSPTSSTSSRRVMKEEEPPGIGPWPDMDRFKSLLRNEASMRLHILGDDYSDSIQDEGNWRLNLYRNWLSLLQNGIGTPIIESRNDRRIRLLQQQRRENSNESFEADRSSIGRPITKARSRRHENDDR
jgi:hypothetical protein